MNDSEDRNGNGELEHEPIAQANETKAEKFNRLARYRMTKALERIEQIGYLGNRSQYEFNDQQISKMYAALNDQLNTTFQKFKERQKDKGFSFDE
jgi:hypothetical protein